jgi:uncharacterized membrane protein YhfC
MVGTTAYIAFGLMIAAGLILPTVLCIWWLKTRHEKFTSVLTGAMTFLIFALVLESIVHSIVFMVFPGIKDNVVAYMLYGALMAGIFEETGRLVAFKTLLRKRTNRETSISYGIGHGGIEVVFVLGLTYFQFLSYAMMLNNGTFGTVVAQVAEKAPEKLSQVQSVIDSLTGFTFTSLLAAAVERVFAVLFHIGASILVFYACKDKKKFWLYPLAILLHTAMDFIAALALFNVVDLSGPALTGSVAVFSTVVFASSYFLLYRKDTAINN